MKCEKQFWTKHKNFNISKTWKHVAKILKNLNKAHNQDLLRSYYDPVKIFKDLNNC